MSHTTGARSELVNSTDWSTALVKIIFAVTVDDGPHTTHGGSLIITGLKTSYCLKQSSLS
jgi:hypothetical protein